MTYNTRKPTDDEYMIQKLIVLFMMTYVGAPMIYYGDEVGMWGANDPCCRKPMLWDDMIYAPEAYQPDGTTRAIPDPVAVNHDLLATYKKLIALRRSLPALSLGDFATLLIDDANQVYAYRRSLPDQTVIVALNNTRRPQQVTLPISNGVSLRDVLNGDAEYTVSNGQVTLEVQPLWGAVGIVV